MPRYVIQCDTCGHLAETLCQVHERPREGQACERCGSSETFRRYGKMPTVDQAFHQPIEMFSVAPESPDQLRDMREKLPDLEFTSDLVPIAHNRQEKLAILKAVGFEERN